MASMRCMKLCKRRFLLESNFSLLCLPNIVSERWRKCTRCPVNTRNTCSQGFTTERCVARKRKWFTPGPLMVSERVKKAMLTDLEIRHADFAYVVKFVRRSLLQIAKVSDNEYTAIPFNGSGTFAMEATLRTVLGNDTGKLIVMENGLYGKQIAHMAKACGLRIKVIPVNIEKLQHILLETSEVSGVVVSHCETSSGIVNPVNDIGELIKRCLPDCLYFVDAATSFGALPLSMPNIDFLIGNSYKCLQGVPGISFVLARKEKLQKHRCRGDGLVLDLGAQYDELERSGTFMFTPSYHVMLAFKEALLEFADEGGLIARSTRYRENCKTLRQEMTEMGFCQLYKDEENPDGFIVTSYLQPNNPLFIVEEFRRRLSDTGNVICAKQMNALNCFRIASIGHMFPDDIRELTVNIREVCQDMRIELPLDENSY